MRVSPSLFAYAHPPPTLSEISVIGSVAFRKRRATTEDTSSAINKTRLAAFAERESEFRCRSYSCLSLFRNTNFCPNIANSKTSATHFDVSTERLLCSLGYVALEYFIPSYFHRIATKFPPFLKISSFMYAFISHILKIPGYEFFKLYENYVLIKR